MATILGPTIVDQIANACLKFNLASDVNLKAFLEMAANPSTQAYPGLRDLSPASYFFQKYIDPGTDLSYQTVKVQTGTIDEPQVTDGESIDGTGGDALAQLGDDEQVPVFQFFQIPTLTYEKKLSDDTYISFIRGTRNDPLRCATPRRSRAFARSSPYTRRHTSIAYGIETANEAVDTILAISAAFSANGLLAEYYTCLADDCRTERSGTGIAKKAMTG